MANDLQSLAHTRWNCKYHIVFAPKYRRMVFYGEKKTEIGKYCDNYVSGREWRFTRRKYARIISTCW